MAVALTSTDPDTVAANWLLGAAAVRHQANVLLEAGLAGRLEHFSIDLGALVGTSRYVCETILQNYPGLVVPYHARWRHFCVGGRDRWQDLAGSLEVDAKERARIRFDLAITSVLLDAGAGAAWKYTDPQGGGVHSRSEGLALASLDLFARGGFSSDRCRPLMADAAGLMACSDETLETVFQVRPENPLVGVRGRCDLMRRLGKAVADRPRLFGEDEPRIGNLVDYIWGIAQGKTLRAAQLLRLVLDAFEPVWPDRLHLAGRNLGDTWRHPAARAEGAADGLVPFHKLSQWLTYSLVEPLEELGLQVTGLDDLTGLAEYRNGGLMIDTGLLQAKHDGILGASHEPGSEVIVEWRALTVALLDRIAEQVRQDLKGQTAGLPLASVLEGGTWAAGRRIAAHKRADGIPPLNIISDGSLF